VGYCEIDKLLALPTSTAGYDWES